MTLVAGLDVGGSSVKAWVHAPEGVLAQVAAPTRTLRPAADRAEFEPDAWQDGCRSALAAAVERAGRPTDEYAGVTACSLRQGFVLLDGAGQPLGRGVLNSDRRGGPYASVLEGRHDLTGHWPAPELTLPKLLAVAAEEPERWAATAQVLFVHDWLLALLSGERVTEASYACAGGMADVAHRRWAGDLLDTCAIGTERLAPLVEAGTPVGRLREGWGLPAGLPVVAGCGDTQLAAAAVGGLADGVVVVVAGSSTPVIAATAAPVADPLGRPWVSTHADPGLWAAEGNAGYPGTFSGWWRGLAGTPDAVSAPVDLLAVTAAPYWSRETWERRPPGSLVGLRPDTTVDEVAAALLQAHAYAVRGNLADLERALGAPARDVVVTGGGAVDGTLPALLADVLGRDVRVAREGGAAEAGGVLVRRALGEDVPLPGLPERVLPAGDRAPWDEPYERWCAAHTALRAALPL